jgi:hypothetical protein
MQLSSKIKITKVKDHTADGTSAVNSDGVDMAGFEGVIFITSFGTAASGNTVNAAQGADNASDWVDLTGSSVTSGTSDEDVWIDINKPSDRYVRAEVARGTSSTLESIYAIQYGPKKLPVDNTTSGTIAGEAHVSVAEGTA